MLRELAEQRWSGLGLCSWVAKSSYALLRGFYTGPPAGGVDSGEGVGTACCTGAPSPRQAGSAGLEHNT